VRSGRASLGGFAELTECPEREAGYAEELWCPVMRPFHETVTWRAMRSNDRSGHESEER